MNSENLYTENIQPNIYYEQPFQPPRDYKKPIRNYANIVGTGLILMLATSFVVSLIMFIPFSAIPDALDSRGMLYQVLNAVSYIAMFVVPIFVIQKLSKMSTARAFPLKAASPGVVFGAVGISLGAVVIGSIITGLLYNAVSLTGYEPVYPDMPTPRGLPANILFFISIAVLPAFFEEFLFRGVIMQSLRPFGDSFALVVSSVLFGIAHGNFIQAPYSIVLGLVMGYFTLYAGSLWPAIAIHFVNNATSVIMQWLTEGTTTAQDEVLATGLFLFRLVIGASAFIIFKVKKGSVFYIPPSQYPLKQRSKYRVFFTAITVIIYLIASFTMFITNLQPVSGISDYML